MSKKSKSDRGRLAQIVRKKNSTKIKSSKKIYNRRKKTTDE